MKCIKVCVLDDERNALDIVSTSVKKVFASNGVEAEVSCFSTVKELWTTLKSEWFNLLFLDINMPQMDGITFGKKISELEKRPDIVFVSSNSDRVFETFAVNPFGFVRKDNFIKDLSSVIERYIKQKMEANTEVMQFEIKEHGGLTTINLTLVKYIECIRNAQTFYMDGLENCTIYSRMGVLEEQVKPYWFIRIHKGYLVNCRYIKRVNTNTAVLTTGEEIPVGRSKRAEVMNKFLEYMRVNGISIIG